MTGHIHSSLPLRGLTTNDSQTVADERRISKNAIPIRGHYNFRSHRMGKHVGASGGATLRQAVLDIGPCPHGGADAPEVSLRCPFSSFPPGLCLNRFTASAGLGIPPGPASGERELRAQEERASDFLFRAWPCVTTGAIPPREWRSVGGFRQTTPAYS